MLAVVLTGIGSIGQTIFGFSGVTPSAVPPVQVEKSVEQNKITPPPYQKPPETKQVYVDPDPIITCTSSYPNCLGKSLQVRQSECSKTYCCGIGDKWSIYLSEGQCKQAQKNAGNVTQNNYVPPVPSGQIKIKCDLSSGEYHYDFGEITYDECKRKSDNYFAQKRAEINSQGTGGSLQDTLKKMAEISNVNYYLPTAEPLKVPVTYCHDQVVQIAGNAAVTQKVCETVNLQ